MRGGVERLRLTRHWILYYATYDETKANNSNRWIKESDLIIRSRSIPTKLQQSFLDETGLNHVLTYKEQVRQPNKTLDKYPHQAYVVKVRGWF